MPPIAGAACLLFAAAACAQTPAPPVPLQRTPLAIVPVASGIPGQAATVTGALEVTAGKAIIAGSGSITSGSRTTDVTLPRRGTLRVCASTTVKLAADTSSPAAGNAPGTAPGLLMAMDHGAVEMSFATTPANEGNADTLLTPDFRILISGPGSSEVKVRLGNEGDTCIDNSGMDAPYVVVTSLFESGLYRVQPGQRVMFQHGSLQEVIDQEKEPCGCPPPAPQASGGNEFPLAQSEGLAPTPAPAPAPPQTASSAATAVPPLVYSASQPAEPPAVAPSPATPTSTAPASTVQKKKPGVFTRLGHFFRKIFGAE